MRLLDRFTDSYDRQARLLPALLVVLPLSVFAVAVAPVVPDWWSKALAIALASGMPFAVVQVVRDRGWRSEHALFESWGGKPTAVMLRWEGHATTTAVRRRHLLVARHLGIRLPDAATEKTAPAEADEAYEAATAALRERTRDATRFPLVMKELIAYGFRRNTYACRWITLSASAAAAVLTLALPRFDLISLTGSQQVPLILFDATWIVVWWLVCTPQWVRNAAERYARQLFASLELLEADRRSGIS